MGAQYQCLRLDKSSGHRLPRRFGDPEGIIAQAVVNRQGRKATMINRNSEPSSH